MHHGFALRYIPQVMNWSLERENSETTWLRLISEFKYDSYQDFLAGSRFVEALLDWLQQFSPKDRELAYMIVRKHLIFISLAEMRHVVQRAYPAFIRPLQAKRAARKLDIPEYLVWSSDASIAEVDSVAKKTLYIGLSDGARLDSFRRANVGRINNEQIVIGYEIGEEKWENVHDKLKERTTNPDAKFEVLVLLDDFAASGRTLIRYEEKEKEWAGKLPKISRTLSEHSDMFSHDCIVLVHHYVGTELAKAAIEERISAAKMQRALLEFEFLVSFDLCLSSSNMLRPRTSPAIDALVVEYYDPNIMTKSLWVGGEQVMHGFAGCGLPLVMEHNTPNNSLALLWAESLSPTTTGHQMRPLFRRRQRHF